MTPSKIIYASLITFAFMSCNQDDKILKKKQIVQDVSFEQSIKEVEPPPPEFSSKLSKFKSLEDWLTDICTNDKTSKATLNINIGLFESKESYVLFLVGTNTYNIDKTHSEIHNDFIPTNMYFKLPKKYYDNLTRDDLLQKLISDLTDFTKTNTFKTSFLAKTDKITFQTTGKKIWTKD